MNKQITCVVRDSFNGFPQYLAVSDLPFGPDQGERLFTGQMAPYTVKDGPYGSHVRTVWQPCGPLTQSQWVTCVVRNTLKGFPLYISITDLPRLPEVGERTFTGMAVSYTVKDGPYNSHPRTAWEFCGAMTEGTFTVN